MNKLEATIGYVDDMLKIAEDNAIAGGQVRFVPQLAEILALLKILKDDKSDYDNKWYLGEI